jgi:hypothetical protein
MIFPDKIIKQLEKVLPRKVWYRDYYLQSKHWKRFKAQIFKSAGRRCEECFRQSTPGALLPIDLHHLNYLNLWHETRKDVKILCRDCHKRKHNH